MPISIPSSREDLADHKLIAEVSSEAPEKRIWTVLSLWWRLDEDRPFVAVVEAHVRQDDARWPQGDRESTLIPRWRASAYGSLGRALEFFDVSQLRAQLVDELPGDVDELYPDNNTIRMRAAEERRAARGYDGPESLPVLIDWLYDDAATLSNNALSQRVERDFGIKARTVRMALDTGGALTGWAPGFLRAMRFFDKRTWQRASEVHRGEPAPDVGPADHGACGGGGKHWHCVHGHKDFCPVAKEQGWAA